MRSALEPLVTFPGFAGSAVTRSAGRHRTSMAGELGSMAAPARSDLALLEALRAGEAPALGELYDRHAATLLGVALRILRNRRDAEDLVHDVFVEAWRRASGYDPSRGSVRTWLLVRTRSRAIDRQRALAAARNHCEAQRRQGPCLAAAADDPARAADHRRAIRSLQALTPIQRQVVELAYFEGLSCTDVASRCNIPVGTVKSRLSAALAKLRSELLGSA